MKKIVFEVAAVLMLIPVVAWAEGGTGETPYTWGMLGTIAGAAAATLLIVQFIKAPLDRVWHIPTRLLVYVIAAGLMLLSSAVMRGLTWPDVPLILLNAVVAATSAMGTYEMTFAKVDK